MTPSTAPLKSIALFVCILILSFSNKAQTFKATDLIGEWEVEEKTAVIKFFANGDEFFAFTEWIKEPRDAEGKIKVDKHNPDPTKRTQPLQGAILCKNFTYAGDGLWHNGTIYDSRTGKTYNCKITMKEHNIIHLRGYIGISLIGGSTTWTRKKA